MEDLFAWGERQATAVKPAPKPAPAPVSAPPLRPSAPPPAVVVPASVELPPARILKTLRDYQQTARENVLAGRSIGHRRQLVVIATGAGKTVVFSALTADQHPGRVLILTDQVDLVDQTVANVLETTGLFADIEQAERNASRNAKVVVGMVQSMAGRLDRYPRDWFSLVICDECDRAIAPQWRKVLEHFHDHAHVVGFTATPDRADKKSILGYFEHKAFEIGALELIDRGWLVPIEVRCLPLSVDLSRVETTKDGDYDATQLGHAVEEIFGGVCEALKEHAAGRRILVFTPDRRTSRRFVDVCHAHHLNARHIDGESPDRDEIKRSFRAGEFQILCNPILLGRGYDDPGIDCIVNLRPTQSLALYQQIVGRGTRLFCPHGCRNKCEHEARKKDVLVLDFLYQFKALGPVRPSQLIAETATKAKVMNRILETAQGALDLRELAERAQREIEAELVRAMMDAQKARGGKGEYFNAFQWAANLKLHDLTNYEPETPADAEPADPRVVRRLQKAGFVPESITCRGHAARIEQIVKARAEAGLVSFKMMFWLRKYGVRCDPNAMTNKEAMRILRPLWKRDGRF